MAEFNETVAVTVSRKRAIGRHLPPLMSAMLAGGLVLSGCGSGTPVATSTANTLTNSAPLSSSAVSSSAVSSSASAPTTPSVEAQASTSEQQAPGAEAIQRPILDFLRYLPVDAGSITPDPDDPGYVTADYSSPDLTPEFSSDARRNSGTEAVLSVSVHGKSDGSSFDGALVTLVGHNDGQVDTFYNLSLGGIPSVLTIKTEVRQPGQELVANQMFTDDPEEPSGTRITSANVTAVAAQLKGILDNAANGVADYPVSIPTN